MISFVTCRINGNEIEIIVEDNGHGIDNIEQARQPLLPLNHN